MPCPICGANCQCKRVGEGGMCCSCHRHRPRRSLGSLRSINRAALASDAERRSLDDHIRWAKPGQQQELSDTSDLTLKLV